jgi:branched-chain amino acid transport system ATP-binding protein
MSGFLLQASGVDAFYGKSHILKDFSLAIRAGEIVSLLGRNGSGRSTALRTIMGLVPVARGRIRFGEEFIENKPPYTIARSGLAFVPEEREVFANLTVEENLVLGVQGPRANVGDWKVEHIYEYFPRLRERAPVLAGSLSGGEQQMLSIGRALLGNPSLVLIDEPTEGLAPMIVHQIADVIRDMRDKGIAVILVEQKLTIALSVSSRVSVLGHGSVVFEGTPDQLRENNAIVDKWMAL